jgi:hypothetical protein
VDVSFGPKTGAARQRSQQTSVNLSESEISPLSQLWQRLRVLPMNQFPRSLTPKVQKSQAEHLIRSVRG